MHRNPGAILLHNTCFQNHVLGGGAKLEIVDALTQPGARKDGVLQQLDLKTKPPDCLQACKYFRNYKEAICESLLLEHGG